LHKGKNHDVSVFLDSNGVRFGDWRSSIDSQERRILMSAYEQGDTLMQTIYIAETRDQVKISDDRDCLPADAIRIETRVFASDADIFQCGFAYQKRGFEVCIDTTSIDCYEFGPDELARTQAHALISRKPFTLQ
jgi:hypothetical protein